MLAGCGLEIGSCEVTFMTEHVTVDVIGELFILFLDVAEEGITGPVIYHHASEDEKSYEVHGHNLRI